MHFDFVDIGTCDFDTCLQHLTQPENFKILLVEPLAYYLDKLPNYPNIVKDNVGISNKSGTVKVFYLPEELIIKHQLPFWVKGCNSLEIRHFATDQELKNRNLSLDLVETKDVPVITFKTLCDKHSIDSIGYLKIDTEGHEQYILPEVLDKVKNGFVIDNIEFENQSYLGNKAFVDSLRDEFIQCGYKLIRQDNMDVVLKKLN